MSSLIRDLIAEISELIREEFRLARAETSEKIFRAQQGLIVIAAGLLLALCALFVLLQAAVVGLAEIMAPWAASLVVAAVTAVAAFVLLRIGQKRLAPAQLVPERTIDSLRQDKDMVLEKAR